MAFYTEILDTQIDPDAPLTSALGGQWRDNPLAVFEGQAGAPRIAQKSMVGNAGAGASITFSFGISFGGFLGHIFTTNPGASSRNLSVAASDDGSTYGASSTLFTVAAGTDISGVVFCDFSAGTIKYAVNLGSPAGSATSSGTIAVTGMTASTEYFRFTNSTDMNTAVMILPNGGETVV